MIVDLRTNLPGVFQYGTWDGKIATTQSGLVVLGSKGAQGSGGIGCNIDPSIDLGKAVYLEVALGVAAGNEVPQVTIALNDADGTQFSARLLIEQLVPGQPVWLRVRRENFKLNDVEKGTDSLMDWTKVARWHLQGDWTTTKPCNVIFIALRARK